MAANLTPQYHAAEQRYRQARDDAERLAALEEMWRELPKHKSSEKLQAELKRKLSEARQALQRGRHRAAARHDPYDIPRSGAGQIALIGTPNTGKSSIVAALTHAHVRIADFPFATALPVPGMMTFEDVQIELVDTPPVTAEHVPAGLAGLWRRADALALVADLSADSLLDDVGTCLAHLEARRIELTGPAAARRPAEAGAALPKSGLLLANKLDVPGARGNLALLRELLGTRLRIEPISTRDPADVARLGGLFFEMLGVIRVYAKPPGRKPDRSEPFILPLGSTVLDVARKVHRGLAEEVRAARIWGQAAFPGQNVQLDHVLHDKDIVELHV